MTNFGIPLWAAVFTLLSVAGGSAPTSAYGEVVTGCLNQKGKLKQIEFGNNPRKPCKNNERLVMLPTSDKTDELMEDVTSLEKKDQQLMDKDMELMDKDMELMGAIAGLESKDEELMAAIEALQEEINKLLMDP